MLLEPGPGKILPKIVRRSGPCLSSPRKRIKERKKKPDSSALPDVQLPAYCTQPTSKRQKLAAWQPSAGGQKEGSQDSAGSLVDLAVPPTATGRLQGGPAVGSVYRMPSTDKASDSAAPLPSGLQLHMPQTPPGHPGAALAAKRRLEQAQPSAGLPSGKRLKAVGVSGKRSANARPADDKPQRQRRNAAVQCQQRMSDIATLESSINGKQDIGMGIGPRNKFSRQQEHQPKRHAASQAKPTQSQATFLEVCCQSCHAAGEPGSAVMPAQLLECVVRQGQQQVPVECELPTDEVWC